LFPAIRILERSPPQNLNRGAGKLRLQLAGLFSSAHRGSLRRKGFLVSQRCGGGASEGAPVRGKSEALAVGFNTWHLAKGVRPRVSGDNGHAGQWSTTNPGTLQNKRVLKNKKAVRSFWYALTTSNTNISMVPSKKYTYLIDRN